MESPIKKMRDEEESIQVFVRIRPLNHQEKSKHSYSILDSPGTREIIVRERSGSSVTKTFTFDRAFGPQSKQIEVYKAVVAPLLQQVMQGYNCTVFAYGQTGTGKTFTMEGERSQQQVNWSEDPMAGIVPRALGQLFDELRQQNSEFTIRVSLLELYNEELYDLLAPVEGQKLKNLRMFEDPTKKNSVTIQGLEEVIVRSKHEVYQIMEKGSERRKTAATLMNAHSSRSHTVLTVTVHIKESTMEGEDLLKVGKLHLVDLAGSENIGRSGAVDKRAREAGNINQSLLTLGRVITALVERAPHVPYRESKLTRILKDSLGGNTKTSIIATVSPAHINVEETLSTLDYAHRAKNILNQPTVNQRLTKHVMISHYTEEIERLRRDLAASREKNGVWVDKANYDEMESKIVALQQELTNNATHTKNLNNELETCQTDLANKEAENEELKSEISILKDVLHETKTRLNDTRSKLKQTEQAKQEQEFLVERHVLTEQKNKKIATELISTADTATMNLEKLYTKLERKRTIEQTNLEAGKRMKKEIADQLEDISNGIDSFRSDHASFCGEQRLKLDEFLREKEKLVHDWKQDFSGCFEQMQSFFAEFAVLVANHGQSVEQQAKNCEVQNSEQCTQILDMIAQWTGKLESTQQAITEKLEDIGLKVEAMGNNFKNEIKLLDKTVLSYVQDHLQDILVYKDKLNSLCLAQSDFNKKISSHIEKRKEVSAKHVQDVKNQLSAVMQTMGMLVKKSEEHLKEDSTWYNELVQDTVVAEETIKSTVSEALVRLSSDEDNALLLSSSMQSNVGALISLTETQALEITQAAQNAKHLNLNSAESLKQWKTQEIEEVTAVKNALREHVQGLQDTTKSFSESADSVQKRLGKESLALRGINEKLSTMANAKDTEHVSNAKGSLETHCHLADEWSETQRSKVYQQAGIVREFWDSTYLVDAPTGATPRKQEYNYPKNVYATSPHEKIISSFRAMRRINDDDDEDTENF